MKIKKTRQENTYTCGNCGQEFLNTSNKWRIVDERIICYECSTLKGNGVSISVEEIIYEDRKLKVSEKFKKQRDKLIKEIDYLELHKIQMEIGELAEQYVFEYEVNRLRGTSYEKQVDKTKARNPNNGYDILSYSLEGNKKYIEVKGTSKSFDEEFFITANEIDTMRKLNKGVDKYQIYRVSNILSENINDIELNIIDNILENEEFEIEAVKWKIKCNAKK